MAYEPTYTGQDLGAIVIDIIGKFGVEIGNNAATIASLLVVAIVLGIVAGLWARGSSLFRGFRI